MLMKVLLAVATAGTLVLGTGSALLSAADAPKPASAGKKDAKKESAAIPKWVPTTLWQWTDIPGSTPGQYMKADGSGILPKAWSIGGQGSDSYGGIHANGGPCWSDKHKEFWFAGQGGHKASLMNPVVKCRFDQESPDWVALDPGSTFETVKKDWDNAAAWNNSAYQSDGRKKSDHSYRDSQYMDCIDEVICVGVQAVPHPIVDNTGFEFTIAGWPRDGKKWRPDGYWGTIPACDNQGIRVEECICQSFDGTGIYTTHGYGIRPLHFFNVKTKEWKQIGTNAGGFDQYMRMSENSSGTLLQTKKMIYEAGEPIVLWFIDSKTGAPTRLTTTGDAFKVGGVRDIVYSPVTDKWYICAGGIFEVTKTGPAAVAVALKTTTGTPVTDSESYRGMYYCSDWKCIVGYDGFNRPAKIIRVAK